VGCLVLFWVVFWFVVRGLYWRCLAPRCASGISRGSATPPALCPSRSGTPGRRSTVSRFSNSCYRSAMEHSEDAELKWMNIRFVARYSSVLSQLELSRRRGNARICRERDWKTLLLLSTVVADCSRNSSCGSMCAVTWRRESRGLCSIPAFKNDAFSPLPFAARRGPPSNKIRHHCIFRLDRVASL